MNKNEYMSIQNRLIDVAESYIEHEMVGPFGVTSVRLDTRGDKVDVHIIGIRHGYHQDIEVEWSEFKSYHEPNSSIFE